MSALEGLLRSQLADVARIRHQLPAADADALALRGRAPSSRFDVLSSTPASSSGPRDQAGRRLDALTTKVGDGCGLACRRLFVGFSGGLDSTVLLHVTRAVDAGVTALHVHHGLHPDAGRWQRHCADFCRELGVGFLGRRADPEDGGEAAARAARYRVFEDELEAGDLLLLGHHRDDQAETVLLRLIQGRAPLGMPRARRLECGARILRPWLSTPRDELLRHARETGLNWIDDPTNAEVGFDRNFLRREIVPRLAGRWPGVAKTLAAGAATQGARDALLEHLLDRDMGADAEPSAGVREGAPLAERVSAGEREGASLPQKGSAGEREGAPLPQKGSAGEREGAPLPQKGSAGEREGAPLPQKGSAGERGGAPLAQKGSAGERGGAPLAQKGSAGVQHPSPAAEPFPLAVAPGLDLERFPADIRAPVLRLWLQGLGEFSAADRALAEFVRQFDAPPDAHPRLALRHGVLRRHGARAVYTGPETKLRTSYRLDPPGALDLPHGRLAVESHERGFHAPGALEIRFRRGGERLKTGGRTRSVKKLLQAAGVPPWQRRTWPLVYCGDALLAVPGIATADSPGRRPRWRIAWHPAPAA